MSKPNPWITLTDNELTDEEVAIFTSMLVKALELEVTTLSGIGYENESEDNATTVFTVAFTQHDAIGYGFTAPDRIVVAVLDLPRPKADISTPPTTPEADEFERLMAEFDS